MLSRVAIRLRVPTQRFSFSTRVTINYVNNQQPRIPCSDANRFQAQIYLKGMEVFGVGGFAFAMVFSAAMASDDARSNKRVSAKVQVVNLFARLVSFPIICGIGWPLIVTGVFGYNFYLGFKFCWNECLNRIAKHKQESEDK